MFEEILDVPEMRVDLRDPHPGRLLRAGQVAGGPTNGLHGVAKTRRLPLGQCRDGRNSRTAGPNRPPPVTQGLLVRSVTFSADQRSTRLAERSTRRCRDRRPAAGAGHRSGHAMLYPSGRLRRSLLGETPASFRLQSPDGLAIQAEAPGCLDRAERPGGSVIPVRMAAAQGYHHSFKGR